MFGREVNVATRKFEWLPCEWEFVMRWILRGPFWDPLPRPRVIVMRWILRGPFGDPLPRPFAAAAVDATECWRTPVGFVMRWTLRDPFGDSLPHPTAAAELAEAKGVSGR